MQIIKSNWASKDFSEPKDWPTIIRAWESSGVPQKEFCTIHGVSYTAFVYNRTQFNKQKNKSPKLLPVQLTGGEAIFCCVFSN